MIFLLIFILLILLLLLVARVKVALSYVYAFEGPHLLEIQISILRVSIWKRKMNFQEQEKRKDTVTMKEIKTLLKRIKRKPIKKIKMRHLSWITAFGAGDAQATGISAAGLWTLKELIIFAAKRYLTIINRPRLEIKPDFQNMRFRTSINCTFSLSSIAFLKFYKQILKEL